jgi:hypothetical protein
MLFKKLAIVFAAGILVVGLDLPVPSSNSRRSTIIIFSVYFSRLFIH